MLLQRYICPPDSARLQLTQPEERRLRQSTVMPRHSLIKQRRYIEIQAVLIPWLLGNQNIVPSVQNSIFPQNKSYR